MSGCRGNEPCHGELIGHSASFRHAGGEGRCPRLRSGHSHTLQTRLPVIQTEPRFSEELGSKSWLWTERLGQIFREGFAHFGDFGNRHSQAVALTGVLREEILVILLGIVELSER